jgi:hypothetical protein
VGSAVAGRRGTGAEVGGASVAGAACEGADCRGGKRFSGVAVAAVAHGAVSVHQLIAKFQPRDGSFAASISEAEPYARGVSVVLTDAEVEMRAYLPGVLTLGSVSTVAQLDQWIEFARARSMLVEVAFLLSRDAADAALRQRLEQLAKPNELRRWSVYRFQVR